MGCSCTIRDGKILPQAYFITFEKSLGLHKISSKKIDRVIYRYSTKGYLSIDQLDKACKSLATPFFEFIDFYSYFLEDGFYSARKLSLLGVLLGKGEEEIKCGILFDNFDYDLSIQLEVGELEMMLKNIFSICCDYEPSYIASKNSEDYELEKCVVKYKESINLMVDYYLPKLLDQEKQISKEKFIEMLKVNNFILMDPVKIREESLKILSNEMSS